MSERTSRISIALLVVFVLSGVAGLLYQSVWSHYLGLTLGHAAYAQTLVLAIFMGGMAVGAWLASRYAVSWRRLILGYAAVEGLVGVLGLAFHPFFLWYTGFSQTVALPAIGSAGIAHAYQWLTATLMIAPQSVLLGATFPLMSAGLIRVLPGQQGEALGGLYFSNSLGAAIGALVATFVLLPLVGLPGTMLTAGLLNIVVALLAWALSKVLHEGDEPVDVEASARASTQEPPLAREEVLRLGRVVLWATAVSGAASFVYEIGWIRLLNQALGTTIHSFELMLAAFILGLAFGGLWVRKRAASILSPMRYVGYVQVFMAVAALLSIPIFTQSFQWVGWIMGALSRNDGGYLLYEVATATISLLVMFPAAFLAGMTLPLFTVALLRAGAGEQSIGRVYAANTIGAIIGVAAMVHLLIPAIGVQLAIVIGAVADGLVGLWLLRARLSDQQVWASSTASYARPLAMASVPLVLAIGVALVFGRVDPREQISGVFRTGIVARDDIDIEYLRDGKTATVGVFQVAGRKAIATNGKPDASLSSFGDAPTPDEITMVMAAALPLALHPAPERIAFIGWGSGLSTHTILGSKKPHSVDTIEIEPLMYEAAKLYGPRVSRAYTDPRSNLRVNDARTFFSTGAQKYDAIMSEPSNPWVSGVASLFTREFYAFLKSHLEDDGMLIQWLHVYELDDRLLATMIAALISEFPNSEVYVTNSADLMIVAHADPRASLVVQPYPLAPAGSELEAELQRVGFDRPEHLALRRLGGPAVLENFVRVTGAIPHSDFYPVVALEAPKTRFKNSVALSLLSLASSGLPILDVLDCRRPVPLDSGLDPVETSELSQWRDMAARLAGLAASDTGREPMPGLSAASLDSHLALRSLSAMLTDRPDLMRSWSDSMGAMAVATIGHLSAEDVAPVWKEAAWIPEEARQLPEVGRLLAAYQAAADRDVLNMRVTAERVLESELDLPSVREQMLVLAMLGAIAQGAGSDVAALDAKWSPSIGHSQSLAFVRAYLLAWSDAGKGACIPR